MKATKFVGAFLCIGLFATTALAVPGEYWEVSSKMDMAGMSFAIPETNTKVCISSDKKNDPGLLADSMDKSCKMTDIKTVGNTTTWKMNCNSKDGNMTGTGEITHTVNAYNGATHLSGKQDGEPFEMSQTFKGKKVGGACDTDTPPPAVAAVQKQLEENCRLDNYSERQLVYSADLYLGAKPLCKNQKEPYCKNLRAGVDSDKETYNALVEFDGQREKSISVARMCGIDMEHARQKLCQTNSNSDYPFLEKHCPVEAKAYLEAERQTKEKAASAPTGRSYTAAKPSGLGSTADTVLDGAKKLKGLFGF